jgi:hypothetical protein
MRQRSLRGHIAIALTAPRAKLVRMGDSKFKLLTRGEIEAVLASEDVEAICDTLVNMSFHFAEEPWFAGHVARLGTHPNPKIRRVASICQGYTTGPTPK